MLSWALAILYLVSGLCEASNILIISTVSSHSHSLWCNKLAELLVNKGHEVTILDTDPPRKKLENLTTYHLEGAYECLEDVNYDQLSSSGTPTDTADFIYHYVSLTCKAMISSPTFKRFLAEHADKTKPYDLIIDDISNCEAFLGLVPFLGHPKLIGVSAFGDEQAMNIMGSIPNMVHTPLHMSSYTHPMSYKEKLENFCYSVYNSYIYYGYLKKMDAYSKEVFGKSTPHVSEIGRSAALALVNTHPILNGAKHYSPAIVQIPGFHIDEPKSLDPEIQAFLDGAEHGAIYFSLGSNILSSLMSKERIQMFLNVFKNLKLRVLWKFEDDSITNWPKNVMVSKWFRQSDILAHTKIKIFISHCGLLGTQEAIRHGVPMVAIPFIIDQHFIAEKLKKKGVAFPLSYHELSESKIKEAIYTLLNNESYRTKMKRMSRIFKDPEKKPRDLAVYWIEYVLRHEDLTFLKPPEALLSRLELYLLDVRTFLGIALGLILPALMKYMSSNPSKYGIVFVTVIFVAYNTF